MTADLDALEHRLMTFRKDLAIDPLANPVRRLSHELSMDIEAGRLTLDDTDRMIGVLSQKAAETRAEDGSAYLHAAPDLADAVSSLLEEATTIDELRQLAEQRLETIVFTGHPTFAMAPGGGAALRGEGAIGDATLTRSSITLDDEHGEACRALHAAAEACVTANRLVLKKASEKFGDDYRTILPACVGLATWVGYDLDGRQDIGWTRIFRHRLIEKADALKDYVERLKPLEHLAPLVPLCETLEAAKVRAMTDQALFCDDARLGTPQGIAEAANALTAQGAGRLVSLQEPIAILQATATDPTTNDDDAVELLALAGLMKMRGLGLGEIHFRLNASQIRNAARSLLPIDRNADLFGHKTLNVVNKAAAEVKPLRVNFASLAEETSSARRIPITAAQILKHVDADTPIRLLIAECENPVTVLTAVYLTKRYGTEDRLDICPLFETAKSFDRSRRILSVLLSQPAYREQVERRKRICIEAGFSDAGRFMGQLPATLAIERLQAQLAKEMARQGLSHLEAVVFNTHGESMGRGGHPGSILERSRYVLSPWARSEYDKAGIRLHHEISFQGGDGFSWFASADASETIIAGLLAVRKTEGCTNDPFYERTEASLDFYKTVRSVQLDLFHDDAMAQVAMGPGLALLPVAGSRKTKRQFERAGEEELSLRRIRAISHNGSLQQLGYVANLHAGVGEAIATEPEAYTELARTSDRFRRLMSLVAKAAHLSDMKTLIAYMKLYDGSLWATRPISGSEVHLERPCGDLAAHLVGDRRYFAALELAALLRPGAIKLNQALERMGLGALGPGPVNLDLLHALRLALMQHMFLLGARLPSFVRAGGFSRPEVLDEILALDVPRAVDQLRQGFPQRSKSNTGSLFDEPADDDETDTGYEAIERETIAPLERAFAQCQRISLAVAHHFGAHG